MLDVLSEINANRTSSMLRASMRNLLQDCRSTYVDAGFSARSNVQRSEITNRLLSLSLERDQRKICAKVENSPRSEFASCEIAAMSGV